MRMSRPRLAGRRVPRRGAAALEFAFVCPILFLIFLGMIEIGRAMMVAGTLTNTARVGARSAGVTGGSYSAATSAITNALAAAALPTDSTVTITVLVNGVAVGDDPSFQAAAVPGSTVSVSVSLSYGTVSWLPGGATLFMPADQSLTGTCSMPKEG